MTVLFGVSVMRLLGQTCVDWRCCWDRTVPRKSIGGSILIKIKHPLRTEPISSSSGCPYDPVGLRVSPSNSVPFIASCIYFPSAWPSHLYENWLTVCLNSLLQGSLPSVSSSAPPPPNHPRFSIPSNNFPLPTLLFFYQYLFCSASQHYQKFHGLTISLLQAIYFSSVS